MQLPNGRRILYRHPEISVIQFTNTISVAPKTLPIPVRGVVAVPPLNSRHEVLQKPSTSCRYL
jgi:hypothetical protein